MAQDPPIQLCFFRKIPQEPCKRVQIPKSKVQSRLLDFGLWTLDLGLWTSPVSHPPRELPQFVFSLGEPMRLQVEQELQPMFGLTEITVSVVENVILLVGEASRLLQSVHCQESIALADLREVAGIE